MKLKFKTAIKLCDIPDRKVKNALYKVREHIIFDESDEQRRFFERIDVANFLGDDVGEVTESPREAERLAKVVKLGLDYLYEHNIDIVLLEPTYTSYTAK